VSRRITLKNHLINDIIHPNISAPDHRGQKSMEVKKIMRDYEALYIIDPELETDDIKQLVDRFKGVIEEKGGSVQGIDEWGKKRLAYPINHRREGYYVLMNFSSNPEAAQDLERVFKITSGLMRYLIVRKDK
ncbi:MAG: small subunit ribosomal protein, partial [Tepidanaerobacteraceae bacterium]|nr:small subunit ribosomal protein [Tepidanaerobacteraceae bacterium]